jgi:DnaK suppressor protein
MAKAKTSSKERSGKVVDDEPLAVHPDSELRVPDLRHLKGLLEREREAVLAKVRSHVSYAISEDTILPDEMDQASRAEEQAILLRLADKERKLLGEIDHALAKIRTGEYGVCEGTGEPIGLRRLEVRPWARYSIQHKELLEREER